MAEVPLPEKEQAKFRAIGNSYSTGVTQDTLLAGEDLTNNVMKVEQRFSYAFVSQASIQIKSGSGFLHGIFVGAISQPSLQIFDNTSNSVLLATMNANPPIGFYMLDVSFLTGLQLSYGAGVLPQSTISYR